MTLDECKQIRDEIQRQITAIMERMDAERYLDRDKIECLRNYCRIIRPKISGRYGNIGSKVSELADYSDRALKDGRLDNLDRGLMAINFTIKIHAQSEARAGTSGGTESLAGECE